MSSGCWNLQEIIVAWAFTSAQTSTEITILQTIVTSENFVTDRQIKELLNKIRPNFYIALLSKVFWTRKEDETALVLVLETDFLIIHCNGVTI